MEMHNVLCAVQSKKNKKPTNAFIATTTYIDHKPRNNAQQWLWLDSECWTPHATCYLYLAAFSLLLYIFLFFFGFWLLAFGFCFCFCFCFWGWGVAGVLVLGRSAARTPSASASASAHRAPRTAHRTRTALRTSC
jgi:hypothetical protein